eukprot:scaffold164133_cov35-Tisochrysis_lutea.AAC.3
MRGVVWQVAGGPTVQVDGDELQGAGGSEEGQADVASSYEVYFMATRVVRIPRSDKSTGKGQPLRRQNIRPPTMGSVENEAQTRGWVGPSFQFHSPCAHRPENKNDFVA